MTIDFIQFFAFLYFCCFVPVRILIHDRTEVPYLWDFALYSIIGWCFLSLLSLLLLRVGITDVRWIFGLGILSLYYIYKVPAFIWVGILPKEMSWKSIATLLVFLIYSLLFFWQSVLMGSGFFPSVFFNVDTPYYLEHVHSLLKATTYPPDSLSNLGYQVGYHYGVQNMAVMLVKLTDIAPHKSMFWYLMPMLMIGTFASVVRLKPIIAQHVTTSVVCILVLFTPLFTKKFIDALLSGQFKQISAVFSDPQLFQQGFPMFSTQMAVLLFVTILGCLLTFEKRRSRILYLICFVLLLIVKTPWFVSVGCIVIFVALFKIIVQRDPSLILWSTLILAVSITIHFCLPSASRMNLAINPGYYFMFLNNPEQVVGYPIEQDIRSVLRGFILFLELWIIPILSIVILFIISNKKRIISQKLLILLISIIAPIIFINIFVLIDTKNIDNIVLNKNILQVGTPFRYSVGILIIYLISFALKRKNSIYRYITYTIVFFFCSIPVFHELYILYKFNENMKHGHEYVNNSAISDALVHIPIDKSIIVTNDFRYPANKYKRDRRQLQIPAIFGHQCYACNFKYQVFDQSRTRLEEQNLLRRKKWNPKLDKYIQSKGWTHFLVHKKIDFPSNIPYKNIYENSSYRVYDLSSKL